GVPCKPNQIITAERGAEQLVHALFYALIKNGRKGALVLYPELHHSAAAALIQIAGGQVVPVASQRGLLTSELLKKAIAQHPDVRMVYLTDPVDPTGQKLDPKEIK